MGRPPLPDEERRESTVGVRVNTGEHTFLAEAARREGLALGVWLRRLGMEAAARVLGREKRGGKG